MICADLPMARAQTREIRYGAAVYGSFLVASVVGLAYETGESVRTMTATAFGSMLIFWLAHAWSEILGENIAASRDPVGPKEARLLEQHRRATAHLYCHGCGHLCETAARGQLLVSETVRLLAGRGAVATVRPAGALRLRGVAEPVEPAVPDAAPDVP